MRHRKSFNHLGRTSAHRKAMLANMAASLVLHKRITTTTAKAKALKMYVEPLITKAKDDSTHSRRIVFRYLQNKEAVTELFREVGAKIADRPGGYTRILKTGSRLGDNADMCIIELVDYNENLLTAKSESKKKSTRRRRGGSGKKSTTEASTAQGEKTEATEEVKQEEAPKADDVKAEAKPEVKAETKEKKEKTEATKDEKPVEEQKEKVEAKKEEKHVEEKKEKVEAKKAEKSAEEKKQDEKPEKGDKKE